MAHPNHALEHRAHFLLARTEFRDWRFHVIGHVSGQVYLQVSFEAPNAESGEVESWRGRKWLLSSHMTDSEIVSTAFLAVMTAMEHETREAFTFKGQAIFGPHFDVHQMAERMAADKTAMLDVRHAPAVT